MIAPAEGGSSRFTLQGVEGSRGGDGACYRHVLPLPAGEGHEELPSTTRGVSWRPCPHFQSFASFFLFVKQVGAAVPVL